MFSKLALLNNILVGTNNADKCETYNCPNCNGEVVFYDGDERSYFRHKEMLECNYYSSESNTHFDAKLKLKYILLNNEVRIQRMCNCGVIMEFTHDKSETVELEYAFGDLYRKHYVANHGIEPSNTYSKKRADVVAINESSFTIYEVFKTHKTCELDRPEPWYELSAAEILHGDISTLRCHRDILCNDCIARYRPGSGCIYAKQRGAGCGKTYESIQMLNTSDKQFFIYLTKMHSAKDVIMAELQSQRDRGQLSELDQFEESDGKRKQYVITFMKNGSNKVVIIGTVDSFMYAITDKQNLPTHHTDYFENIREHMINGHFAMNRYIAKYAGIDIPLLDQTMVIIDETQDLPVSYINAFDSLLQHCMIDLCTIGDKLQSIWYERNIYSHLFSNTNHNLRSTLILDSPNHNIIKRFHNHEHMNFVNKVVKFNNYNMQEITDVCSGCDIDHNAYGIEMFHIDKSYSDEQAEINFIGDIISKIIQRMDRHPDMMPEDFMFIFPTISTNNLAARLEDNLNDYWHTKLGINGEYNRFAFLHKSEDGQPIDISKSKGMSRIMSIHASKGNGTKVVFLIGISEYTLKLFSNGDNLIYESLLHVALTRHKQYLYIGSRCDSDDDICSRFAHLGIPAHIEIGSISGQFRYTDFVRHLTSKQLDDVYLEVLSKNECILSKIEDRNNGIVEWGNHILRYCSLLMTFKLEILKNIPTSEQTNSVPLYMNPIYASIKGLTRKKILMCKYPDFIRLLKKNSKSRYGGLWDEITEIPILESSDIMLSAYLENLINHILNKIRRFIGSINKLNFCPLESVIVTVLLDNLDKGIYSSYSFTEIYEIIHAYRESYKYSDSMHSKRYNCGCDGVFGSIVRVQGESNYTGIIRHYNDITKIQEIYAKYISDPYIQEAKGTIKYQGNKLFSLGDSPCITASDELIGYYNDTAIIFLFKPDINKLNLNEMVLIAMVKKFIYIGNYVKLPNGDNEIRKVRVFIVALNASEPLEIMLDIDAINNQILDDMRAFMFSTLSKNHKLVFKFYQQCKENKVLGKNGIENTLEALSGRNVRMTFPIYIRRFFEDKVRQSKRRNIEELRRSLEESNFISCLDDYLNEDINIILSTKSNNNSSFEELFLDL